MSNHIHQIWQLLSGFTPSDIQASFMKYTAQHNSLCMCSFSYEVVDG